jgi:hypothetical protein
MSIQEAYRVLNVSEPDTIEKINKVGIYRYNEESMFKNTI